MPMARRRPTQNPARTIDRTRSAEVTPKLILGLFRVFADRSLKVSFKEELECIYSLMIAVRRGNH